MNAEIKTKWLTALRSGKYEQTKGTLHVQGNGYCCLGVLCDVVDSSRWNPEAPGRYVSWSYGGDTRQGFPPYALLNEIGLEQALASRLADRNDKGATFKDIAQMIEDQA